MVATNLSLYREYQKIISLVSSEIACDFVRLDIKTKIISSQFMEAWRDIRRIFSNICRNSASTFADRTLVKNFSSEVYSHTKNTVDEKVMLCRVLRKKK